MNISNEKLDEKIIVCQTFIDWLKHRDSKMKGLPNPLIPTVEEDLGVMLELRELRKVGIRKIEHHAYAHRVLKGVGIISVSCTCGKTTEYKKPLLDLEDFECPQNKTKPNKVMKG